MKSFTYPIWPSKCDKSEDAPYLNFSTMQGAHTPEMDDSIKTLKAKFKQSYMHQDELFVDLLLGKNLEI